MDTSNPNHPDFGGVQNTWILILSLSLRGVIKKCYAWAGQGSRAKGVCVPESRDWVVSILPAPEAQRPWLLLLWQCPPPTAARGTTAVPAVWCLHTLAMTAVAWSPCHSHHLSAANIPEIEGPWFKAKGGWLQESIIKLGFGLTSNTFGLST